MDTTNLTAVVRAIDDNKSKSGSKRQAIADRVRREIPYHVGRATNTLSNSECKRIGRTYGIVAKTEQRN